MGSMAMQQQQLMTQTAVMMAQAVAGAMGHREVEIPLSCRSFHDQVKIQHRRVEVWLRNSCWIVRRRRLSLGLRRLSGVNQLCRFWHWLMDLKCRRPGRRPLLRQAAQQSMVRWQSVFLREEILEQEA